MDESLVRNGERATVSRRARVHLIDLRRRAAWLSCYMEEQSVIHLVEVGVGCLGRAIFECQGEWPMAHNESGFVEVEGRVSEVGGGRHSTLGDSIDVYIRKKVRTQYGCTPQVF